MSRFRVSLTLIALLALALPAHAESGSDDSYTRSGFYAGLGASLTVALWEDELEDWSGLNADIDKSVGLNLVAGWRFLPWLAGELQYEGVKGYDVKLSGRRIFRMDSHTLTANARVYYPLERWQPYLLAGVGMAHYDIHQNLEVKGATINVGGRLGGGLDFYVTPHFVLNASVTVLLTGFEIEVPGRNVDGLHYLSTQLGVLYRF
jgi:opacity protein-like surface antigen